MCFLGILWILKKPLCIDSTAVQRIDRLSGAFVTTAYGCFFHKKSPYDVDIETYISSIAPHIEKTNRLLDSIRPLKNKLHIVVDENRPYVFQIDKNKIQIGSSLIQSEVYLSRAIIKVWINENKPETFIDTQIVDETVADFLVYVMLGKLDIEDPIDKVKTRLGLVKWPQVIKTPKGYCKSAWKYSEHIESCSKNNATDRWDEDLSSVVYALRPLLTTAWVHSYNEMSWKQKNELLRDIPSVLNHLNLSSEKIVETLMTEKNPLHLGIININKFTELLSSSAADKSLNISLLLNGIQNNLQNLGVTDSYAEAYFDYLVEYKGQLDPQSQLFQNIEKASLQNLDVQVALKDQSGIWILPSKTSLPLAVFNQIKSRQTIYVGCHLQKNTSIEQFFNKTEKLMLINECDKENRYDFMTLLSKGIKSFINSSKGDQFNFVQLHIPSFEMVSKELRPNQNIFELIKNRDITQKELKVLGWTQVQWKKEIGAYRPEAVIEAIEYFRN